MSLFIAFEGPEGSGKSTQVTLLSEALRAEGQRVVRTREPGGTPISEQIRQVLHDVENLAMLPITEILLYSAARAQHVGELIWPALQRGEIVISDRYAASTLAYQGYGRGLDMEMLQVITDFATGGIYPDLVVYLDLDVTVGLERKLGDRREGRGEWNRMDQQAIAFYQRIREGYLDMAKQDSDKWLTIDATQPIEQVHRIILGRVKALL